MDVVKEEIAKIRRELAKELTRLRRELAEEIARKNEELAKILQEYEGKLSKQVEEQMQKDMEDGRKMRKINKQKALDKKQAMAAAGIFLNLLVIYFRQYSYKLKESGY